MKNKVKKIYAEVLDQSTMEQFKSAMEQEFVVSGALMPDAHPGYSLPIGAVVATDGVVLPTWVGYDIGCGMCALRLNDIDHKKIQENSKKIFDLIYKYIPVGFNVNQHPADYSLDGLTTKGKEIAKLKKHDRALGSLGGGNHFIEVGHDEKDNVWVVIHSGSRGVGHGLATHYIKLAHPDGKCKEGHFGLDVKSEKGKDYIQDMNWCLEFALTNRKEMMKRVVKAIAETLGLSSYKPDFSELINRNHNHAVERDGLWIHRKGATHAEEGMMGVIPGNMRDGSFIVRGKGSPDSLYSSSHGAGRVLGRKEAKQKLNMNDFKNTMKDVQALVGKSTLDESPSAYKDIFEVMKLQDELVEVIAHVRPIINVKG